jgi:hypothetical protein
MRAIVATNSKSESSSVVDAIIPYCYGRRRSESYIGSVYMGVNEHFEPIYNDVQCQLKGLNTASQTS